MKQQRRVFFKRTVRWKKKRVNRKSKLPSISKLIKTADALFSASVRQLGANKEGLNQCYTCKKWFSIKKLHCGHFLSRYYKTARWDKDNARPQCMMCNLWKKGDTVNFRINLVNEIGVERVEIVEAKRNVSIKLSREYLEDLIENL